MKTTIQYHGAVLIVDEWLRDAWPFDLDLSKWPTFCGAGEGLGDAIVPDTIRGAIVKPACFIHDVDWATAQFNLMSFLYANWNFRTNLRSLVSAQISDPTLRRLALMRCNLYFITVCTPIGWNNFSPGGGSWRENPVVQSRLQRLASANKGLA